MQIKKISDQLISTADKIGINPALIAEVFHHENYRQADKKKDLVLNAIRNALAAQISAQNSGDT